MTRKHAICYTKDENGNRVPYPLTDEQVQTLIDQLDNAIKRLDEIGKENEAKKQILAIEISNEDEEDLMEQHEESEEWERDKQASLDSLNGV